MRQAGAALQAAKGSTHVCSSTSPGISMEPTPTPTPTFVTEVQTYPPFQHRLLCRLGGGALSIPPGGAAAADTGEAGTTAGAAAAVSSPLPHVLSVTVLSLDLTFTAVGKTWVRASASVGPPDAPGVAAAAPAGTDGTAQPPAGAASSAAASASQLLEAVRQRLESLGPAGAHIAKRRPSSSAGRLQAVGVAATESDSSSDSFWVLADNTSLQQVLAVLLGSQASG
jgi:hypothetical protein